LILCAEDGAGRNNLEVTRLRAAVYPANAPQPASEDDDENNDDEGEEETTAVLSLLLLLLELRAAGTTSAHACMNTDHESCAAPLSAVAVLQAAAARRAARCATALTSAGE
jgi:hypothetical protein